MRELTILESGYLAGLLALSLVLPLLISLRPTLGAATRRACMKTVWNGQVLLTAAGLSVLFSAFLAPFAAGLGFVSTIVCALQLLRRSGPLRSV